MSETPTAENDALHLCSLDCPQPCPHDTRSQVDARDDLAHRIRAAWQEPGVIRYDTDDEWRMAVAAADVALGRVTPPG